MFSVKKQKGINPAIVVSVRPGFKQKTEEKLKQTYRGLWAKHLRMYVEERE
jgi:hypothetical protein